MFLSMTSKKLIRIQNMKLIACPCLKNICAALQDRQGRGLWGQIWAEIKETHATKPCYINTGCLNAKPDVFNTY